MDTATTELTDQQKMSQGLRELADFLDEQPDFPAPGINPTYIYCSSKEKLVELAKLFKPFKKSIDDMGDYVLTRDFGPLSIRLYTSRTNVCTRQVVGQEWREGEAAKPASPATEGRMVDIYEYDCPEHLLSGNGEKESVDATPRN